MHAHSCARDAAVRVRWITSMGPQEADLCPEHARYVQEWCLAREAVDETYSAGLLFRGVGEAA